MAQGKLFVGRCTKSMSSVSTISGAFQRSRIRKLSPRVFSTILLLSTICPPILLYFAFRTNSSKQRHWFLTFLIGYFGVAIPITFEGSTGGSDAVRHLYAVHTHYAQLSFDAFFHDLGDILLLRGAPGSNDPYKHVLSFIFGSVLSLPELFFPAVALVFGYFWVGCMMIIFRNFDYRYVSTAVVFLALCLFLTMNFYSFQAVRNPTAIVMLLYGVLMFHSTHCWRYVVLLTLTPLVHFSFLLIAIPAFVYLFLGPRKILYSSLFVASFFFEAVNPVSITSQISQYELGEEKLRDLSLEGRSSLSDRSSEFQQTVSGGLRGWRGYMLAGYQIYAISILIFSLLLSGIYFSMGHFSGAIFSNGLLMLTTGKFLWFLEGFTGRISTVGMLMVLGAFIIWRTTEYTGARGLWSHRTYTLGLYAAAIALIPYFLYYLSIIMDWLVLFYFVFPVMAWIAPEANLPLKELIKFVF